MMMTLPRIVNFFVLGVISIGLLTLGQTLNGQVQADDQDARVVAAYRAGVETRKQFDLISRFVKAQGQEIKWRDIPWIPGLWEGIKAAEEKQKPMFVWAMNGDPLGCV